MSDAKYEVLSDMTETECGEAVLNAAYTANNGCCPNWDTRRIWLDKQNGDAAPAAERLRGFYFPA